MLEKIRTALRQSRLYNRLVFIKNLRGRLFDLRHGIDTAGEADLDELRIASENKKYGAKYMGSDPKAVRKLFRDFRIDHRDFVFVDLGSGKGRVLFLAAEYPYKKIIGVEFAAELDRIARRNIRNYRSRKQRCPQIETVCGDAAEFAIPPDPLVIYLFNPFSEKILAGVLKNIEDSLKKNPRPIYIFYTGAFHRHIFDESPYFEKKESGDWHILYKNTTF